MENNYFVLGASRYDFETNDGQKLRGCKVRYVPDSQENDDNNVGFKHIELNADYDLYPFFKDGCGIYALGMEIVPGNRGQVKMKIKNARLLKKIDLVEFIKNESATKTS